MGKDFRCSSLVGAFLPFRPIHKVNHVERDAVAGAPRLAIEQTTCPPKLDRLPAYSL